MVSNIVYFPFHIWDVILPIDELIFFKMVIAPPTSVDLCENSDGYYLKVGWFCAGEGTLKSYWMIGRFTGNLYN